MATQTWLIFYSRSLRKSQTSQHHTSRYAQTTLRQTLTSTIPFSTTTGAKTLVSTSKKNVIRGLHFQKGWYSQAKLIKVIKGEILDFVVDLRDDTQSKIEFFEMSEGDEVIVPKGYAHGFITLEDHTVVQYLVDNEYNPSSEGNLVWTNFGSILDKIKEISPEFDLSKVTTSKKDLI